MGQTDIMGMSRAISGDLHHIFEDRTGMDLKGITDPYPLWKIQRLKVIAERRGMIHAMELLEEAEKRYYMDQAVIINRILREDISKLGLVLGNVEQKQTSSLSDIL